MSIIEGIRNQDRLFIEPPDDETPATILERIDAMESELRAMRHKVILMQAKIASRKDGI